MEMEEDKRSYNYRNFLIGATCGDALLYLLFKDEIPQRDHMACEIGMISIFILILFESKEAKPRIESKRFRSIFAVLGMMEMIFTVLIPWLSILEGSFNKSLTHKNGHLLAAHLYVFQTQIAGECLIEMTGDRRTWLVFPFTCIANAYRGITIGTWIQRVMEQPTIGGRDVILPVIAGALWIYSTFIFIPREWYPLIKK